ncbi:Bug family tripartite tricarboxylate transporter substrate binding protein [Reyranella sp.]|uniref:Bug family tripartite tricarboxylate transporter substrate binding protein n=1 Tax=Reyranella sp. TaxID=1929291 RepID=UPI003784932C
MKLPRRRQFLHLASAAAALPFAAPFAKAQVYPSRPVHLVVGFPPGGPTDIAARPLGQWLSERLGQQFVIENRPGAGSNIGTEAVVRAPPDGHTLLLAYSANAINATLYHNLSFDFIRDVAPVASISRETTVMVVTPSFPAGTVPEFVAFAKANPSKINFASGGHGTPPHIIGELFKMMATVSLTHVPYRGGAPAVNDLLGGQVQVMFASPSISLQHVRAGRLRALAVTTATRSQALPDVPTVAEFLSGFEASVWLGIGAPRNTPAAIIDKLNKEINAGLADPGIRARFADLGSTVLPGSPSDFGKLIAEETEKWSKVIRAANLKAE